MQTLDLEYEVDASAERVWSFIQDFPNIEAWWPKGGEVDIERVEVEGSGVGVIRHIHNKGMPAPVSERLDFLDPDNFVWKLSIVGDRPAGIKEYSASGRLEPLGEQRCRIVYHGEFRSEPGRENDSRQFLEGAYQLMFAGLQAASEKD